MVKKLANGLRRYVNFKTLIIVICIIVFILINSIQEDYVGLEEVSDTTLVTTNTGTTPPTPPTNPSEPTGPSFPTDTFTRPDTGVDTSKKPFIPAQMVPAIIAALLGILLVILFLRRRKTTTDYYTNIPASQGVLRSRREKFRTEIKTLVEILKEFLTQERYSEGIIFGFHQLDKNMKRILGIRRQSHLTPKEFASSLDLPEILTYLDMIIATFYLARYKNEEMTYENLEGFIENLQQIKNLSKVKADIEIIDRKALEEIK
jgi:hypothetical protein